MSSAGFNGKMNVQPWMTAPETAKVMAALRDDGGDARFVGGCVRDALVNRKIVDIDLATPLHPDVVMERLTRAKIPYAPTGLKHGTVTAIVDGIPFEITTLRRDVNTHGRHADVAFTSDWLEDAARRDFTINAMSATEAGEVFDPFDGIVDLRLGRVVFVGDPATRIAEDHLRILRFFRFHAHFGKGDMDGAGLEACASAAPSLKKLSRERVRQEVLKLLEARMAPQVWRVMLERGIVAHVIPEAREITVLERLSGLEEKFHDGAEALRRLAALLNVAGKQVGDICRGLRLSNEQASRLEKMALPVSGVSSAMSDQDMRRLVYREGNDMARSLILLAAAREGREGRLDTIHDIATDFRPPRFPLEGQDVLKAGVQQGPAVGLLLSEIETWWLDNDFQPGREACLERLSIHSDLLPSPPIA